MTRYLITTIVACVLVIVACAVLASERSGKWRAVRNSYIEAHPNCERCGKPATDVHHVIPFAVGGPELDPDNLMALCDECHATEAHMDRHYDSWNPLIREEAALHRAMVAARPRNREEAKRFVERFGKCFQVAP